MMPSESIVDIFPLHLHLSNANFSIKKSWTIYVIVYHYYTFNCVHFLILIFIYFFFKKKQEYVSWPKNGWMTLVLSHQH